MPKAKKGAFYAVHIGQQPGIYSSWSDCEQQTKGYPKARYQKFTTEAEADAFVKYGTAHPTTAAAAEKSSTIPSGINKTTYMTKKRGKQKANDVINESEWEIVYTDGACQGNGKVGAIAGIGVWWGPDDPRNLSERCPGDQTNNRAELIALIRVLETAPHSIKRLLIKTDSSYSISCVRDWIPSWRKRGWKTTNGKDVKNKAVILYLANLLDDRSRQGQAVQLQHVRGHVGIAGNEGADKLAGAGALLNAIPDRDWTFSKEGDSKGSGRDTIEGFQVGDGELLSPSELRLMSMSGEFD